MHSDITEVVQNVIIFYDEEKRIGNSVAALWFQFLVVAVMRDY